MSGPSVDTADEF